MSNEDYKIAYENVMTANKMLEQEIERLNNIINEIEKLCIDNLIYDEVGMKVLDQPFILDKIEELKGSE